MPVEIVVKPAFAIGQKVKVSPACEFETDWENEVMYIVGIEWNRRKNRLTYSTHSQFPPSSDEGCVDEWDELELIAVPSENAVTKAIAELQAKGIKPTMSAEELYALTRERG